MSDLVFSKADLKNELENLVDEETKLDAELGQFFGMITGSQNGHSKSLSFDSMDISSSINKVKQFGSTFEAMQQDSKKLAAQVEDCRSLSERLSSIVRRLDLMQVRSQQALACTEDIINLKDCKIRIISAIENKNLSAAVDCLRQVHEIDITAAKSSDDFEIICEKEKEVKEMVQKEFGDAISDSNLESVMALCPLLQTLGLESEARDNFLAFVEKTVFIAVSADAAAVDGSATDPATAYAQALSNIFNSAFLIIQRYLPMVIQGLENSLGDIHFIRKLHKRVEQESGLVLKRYMKFRSIRETIGGLKGNGTVTPAEIHSIMDELALLIQYCNKYSKYLHHVCEGAESKIRIQPEASFSLLKSPAKKASAAKSQQTLMVFAGPSEFHKMVDELVNRFYMEGEHWLMRRGVQNALPRVLDPASYELMGMGLDECFFVLQKCGMRAVATNNIHAACAVLHLISDMVSSDLLSQATHLLNAAVETATTILNKNIVSYKKSIPSSDSKGASNGTDTGSLTRAFSLSLASTISLSATGSGSGDGNTQEIHIHENGGFYVADAKLSDDPDDPWNVGPCMEAFNVVEMCVRYTERLSRDIMAAGDSVFPPDTSKQPTKGSSSTGTGKGGVAQNKPHVALGASSEADKLRLCKEDFDAAKSSFNQAIRLAAERLSTLAQNLMKDLFSMILGRSGPFGGLKFDEPDTTFDNQPALTLLPKILTLPIETMTQICICNLSEQNKDLMVSILAKGCSEKLEHFITQTSFRFSGAMKMEEVVRSLLNVFSRHSSAPVRNQFARLKEITMVLTSDLSTSGSLGATAAVLAENFSHLTPSEVEAFLGLREDGINSS